MRILHLTLSTPAENLALDEALLEEAEAAARPVETLRFWEPAQNMVVVGRSSRVDVEVNEDACRQLGIPILRRSSGGAAIVTGPGCLMYSLVLSYQNRPSLRAVSQAHAFVLETMAESLSSIFASTFGRGAGGEGNVISDPIPLTLNLSRPTFGRCPERGHAEFISGHALEPLAPQVRFCGTSDLAVGDLKFSGNSMRCRKRHFLYHGTILYEFPLELISRCLKIPPRMPDYRNGREHDSFLTNLPVPVQSIRQALISAWNAVEPLDNWPRELTDRLAAEKYGCPNWNEKF